MRTIKFILLSMVLISAIVLIKHMINLPGGSSVGWFKSPRVSKLAHVVISGEPTNSHTWVSRWGLNRPEGDHSHETLSEIEVRLQHRTRGGAELVDVVVTGDSEADVDAFLETLRRDVAHTYNRTDKETGITILNSYVNSVYELSRSDYYWRQKYLGLLVCNVVVLTLAYFMLVRCSKKQAQQDVAPDG